MRKRAALAWLWVSWLLVAPLLAQTTRTGTYIDCLWEGTPEIRAVDTPKLLEAGFDLFATQITGKALDPASVDAKWLDACKAASAQVIVQPNALTPAQFKTLVERYPQTIVGFNLQDDANFKPPAEITAAYNAIRPFLGGSSACITVAKNTKHADYGSLVPWYHVQTYLGKAVGAGDGMKRFAYDRMLEARESVPPSGKLLGAMYLSRNPTPYHLRADPVFRAQEFALPSTQEAAAWLQLIAGADHLLSYTAYSVDRDNPLWESRLGERWDLLGAYRSINAKIKESDPFLRGAGVKKERSVVGNRVMGTWTKPSGEVLTVTVDLTSEIYPRTEFLPKPPPPPPATATVTSDGKTITLRPAP